MFIAFVFIVAYGLANIGFDVNSLAKAKRPHGPAFRVYLLLVCLVACGMIYGFTQH